VGDFIKRQSDKLQPDLASLYPYPHCYLVLGHSDVGYHRTEVYTSGLSYVWYPPGSPQFQPGIAFKFECPEKELQGMYRVLDPWTRNYAKATSRHAVRFLRGETYVWPEIKRGFFSCSTFVLWALGMLDCPHRPCDLIEFLRANPDIFEEYDATPPTSSEDTQGLRWSPTD
jgi:hypothetical protein